MPSNTELPYESIDEITTRLGSVYSWNEVKLEFIDAWLRDACRTFPDTMRELLDFDFPMGFDDYFFQPENEHGVINWTVAPECGCLVGEFAIRQAKRQELTFDEWIVRDVFNDSRIIDGLGSERTQTVGGFCASLPSTEGLPYHDYDKRKTRFVDWIHERIRFHLETPNA